MALPIGIIVEGISTLLNGVGLYVTKQKADKTEEKRQDLGKELSSLQGEVERQTVFITALTQQVQALALQVQQQEAVIKQLKVLSVIAVAVSGLVLGTALWMAAHR